MILFSPNRNRLYSSGGINYLLVCLFSGLSFVLLNSNVCSNEDCSMSKGAKLMISSTSLWFAAGVNVMILYPPCKKRRRIQDEEHNIGESIRDPLLKGDRQLSRCMPEGH